MEKWELSKEEFEKCKKQAVERVVEKFFEELFNQFMVAERGIYLEKEEKDKGNGYYGRKLISKFGKLDLDTSDKKQEIQPLYLLGEKYKRH